MNATSTLSQGAKPETDRWCPQCGPDVWTDEDGCCTHCGCDAIGNGADTAKNTERALATEQAAHEATQALLTDALERIARAERCLVNWPADGAFALRLLRGEGGK